MTRRRKRILCWIAGVTAAVVPCLLCLLWELYRTLVQKYDYACIGTEA